jgi:hypothetical protein
MFVYSFSCRIPEVGNSEGSWAVVYAESMEAPRLCETPKPAKKEGGFYKQRLSFDTDLLFYP